MEHENIFGGLGKRKLDPGGNGAMPPVLNVRQGSGSASCEIFGLDCRYNAHIQHPRKPRLTARRRLAIGIAIVSFIPYALASWHANRYNWKPLDYRIQLHSGAILTPDFLVDVDARYILFLQVEPRRMDFQREDCLLDLELFHPENCKAIPSVVNLAWKLWSEGRLAADESTLQTWRAGSYSNDYVRREIGRFDAHRGKRYTLEVFFRDDPRELNQANPRIVAEAMQDWEGYAIEVQFSFLLGLLAAILAIALFFMPKHANMQ